MGGPRILEHVSEFRAHHDDILYSIVVEWSQF